MNPEIEAWLGDEVELNIHQKAAFTAAWERATAIYGEDQQAEATAFLTSALQQILGESTLEDTGRDWMKAQLAYAESIAKLHGSIYAAYQQRESINSICRRTGASRSTAYNAITTKN